MKKLFSFLSVLVFGVSMLLAQGQSIATLNHDGEVQVFYGTNALYYAHSAATHGDVITLSSGAFNATTITKELTIRGAGMQADSLTNALPTYIIGNLCLEITTDTVYDLTMEGLNIESLKLNNKDRAIFINKPEFIKCKIGNIYAANTFYSKKCEFYAPLFINCDIMMDPILSNGYFNDDVNVYYNNAEFINCRIRRFVNSYYPYSTDVSDCKLINCDVTIDAEGIYGNVIFINSIVKLGTNAPYKTSNYAYMYNCLTDCSNKTIFTEMSNCYTVSSFDGIFEDEETRELTEEAKAKYIGNDNTEVGMYGGAMPFDPKTTAPQITKCNVATKSTADGKLSVDIEVKVAE